MWRRSQADPELAAIDAAYREQLGSVIAIHAPDETMAIEVARLLQPYSG